jgi:mandelate racemase
MPDLMRIAGVSGWLKAAAIAGAAGVPISTHLYPEFAAHLMRVTETADWLEWRAWAEPILQMRYDIRDGLLHIPSVPGVGLAWNEDAVVANQVTRWARARATSKVDGDAGATSSSAFGLGPRLCRLLALVE